jgi:hypothetical protein
MHWTEQSPLSDHVARAGNADHDVATFRVDPHLPDLATHDLIQADGNITLAIEHLSGSKLAFNA